MPPPPPRRRRRTPPRVGMASPGRRTEPVTARFPAPPPARQPQPGSRARQAGLMPASAPPRAARTPAARSSPRAGRPGPPRATRRPPSPPGPDPRFRLSVVLIVILFVLTLVAGKLLELQGLNRSSYSAMAQHQRLNTVTITAPRGAIVDRNGVPLAETVDARDIYADPHEVKDAATAASKL